SSRRRHTRCSRDWSSDVCSSDLVSVEVDRTGRSIADRGQGRARGRLAEHVAVLRRKLDLEIDPTRGFEAAIEIGLEAALAEEDQIGRASCRERGKRSLSESALK